MYYYGTLNDDAIKSLTTTSSHDRASGIRFSKGISIFPSRIDWNIELIRATTMSLNWATHPAPVEPAPTNNARTPAPDEPKNRPWSTNSSSYPACPISCSTDSGTHSNASSSMTIVGIRIISMASRCIVFVLVEAAHVLVQSQPSPNLLQRQWLNKARHFAGFRDAHARD